MNRLRISRMTTACLMALTAVGTARSAPAPSERSGLDQVPATSPIVIHVRGVQGTRDRFVAMMEKALPQVLKKFQPQMDDALKNGIEGRKLRGLVKDGPIFLAFTDMPKPRDNPPKMAIIVAVSNYKEFRDNVLTEDERNGIKANGNGVEAVVIKNETTYFVDRKGYAIVTPNEEVANSFTKKQPGLDGKLSKEQAAKLLSANVGVYVAVDALSKEYAEQMKQARQGLEQLIDLGAAQAGKSEKTAIEMAKKLIGPVFQAVEDSQGVLLTLEFRPGGLALHGQSEVRAGSPTGQFLQDSRPAAFQELALMPDGRTYYTAMKTTSRLYKNLGSFLLGILPDKDSPEAKEVSAALEEMAKAGPGVRLDAFSLPPAGLQVTQYDDPAKAVAAQLKLVKAMGPGGTIQSGVLKDKPVVKNAAEKYGDFELHSVQMVWDLDKMAESAAALQGDDAKKKVVEGLKGLMGEKLNFWLGHDGKSVVQVMAPDWPAARKSSTSISRTKRRSATWRHSATCARRCRPERPSWA